MAPSVRALQQYGRGATGSSDSHHVPPSLHRHVCGRGRRVHVAPAASKQNRRLRRARRASRAQPTRRGRAVALNLLRAARRGRAGRAPRLAARRAALGRGCAHRAPPGADRQLGDGRHALLHLVAALQIVYGARQPLVLLALQQRLVPAARRRRMRAVPPLLG